MVSNKQDNFYFQLALAACGLTYFILTCLYHHYTMIAVDEFWFAHRIHDYASTLPYRDFPPYKTVLGYYLLLPALFSYKGSVYYTLLHTKTVIALMNAIAFMASGYWLCRYQSKIAVIISLILVMTSEITIAYSSQIRVDLFGYWFCLFALFCVLDRRYIWAGILLGLGFSTTQKAIWYVFAINMALGLYWLLFQRSRSEFLAILKMNSLFLLFIFLYIVFWSMLSDFNTVITNVFQEAAAMYQLDWYDPARYRFWEIIIRYNPLLFLLWPACIFSLLATPEQDTYYKQRFIIAITSLSILVCLIPYKQVFPYYMQVTIPLFLASYAAFFSWLIAILRSDSITLLIPRLMLWIVWLTYIIAFTAFIFWFKLPYAYLLIITIPTLIKLKVTYTHSTELSKFSITLAIMTLIVTDLLYPALLIPEKIMYLNNNYQHATIDALEKTIDKEHDFIAGIELLYYHDQPIAGVRHLMGPAIDYLFHPTDKLRSVMLTSLDEDPEATITSIINHISTSNVALYVNNYRIQALPGPIKSYLNEQYEHFWGSLYTYSPNITSGTQMINLRISGQYLIKSTETIILDGHPLPPQTMINLKKGEHRSDATSAYRMQWIPSITVDPIFQDDQPQKVIF